MNRSIASARSLDPAAREIHVNPGPHVPETDQTAQTDQDIETQRKFALIPGRKLTIAHSELTSGPDHDRFRGLAA
jgi:hypothetical protein